MHSRRPPITGVVLFAYAFLGALPLRAQERIGGVFQVNAYTTRSFMDEPSVAAQPDGTFVVVWSDFNREAMRAQRFDAAGARLGDEMQVSGSTTVFESGPRVAAVGDGFVVAWRWTNGWAGSGVAAQRFGGNGAPIGNEFAVSSFTTTVHSAPNVASGANGDFVVVWSQSDGSSYDVFAQRFNATGTKIGAEFQVNSYTTSSQMQPTVAIGPAGNFVVAWASGGGRDFPDGLPGVFGQAFDAAGGRIGGEFQLNTVTKGIQYMPAVAAQPDGFVVAWDQYEAQARRFSIVGRRLDASGHLLGSFAVSEDPTSSQYRPAVAAAPDGSFQVVWEGFRQNQTQPQNIFGRQFDATGQAIGPAFPVNATDDGQAYHAAIAVDGAGRYDVAWTSRSYYAPGILGQRFAAQAVTPTTTVAPTATATPSGTAVATATSSPRPTATATPTVAAGAPFGSFDTPANGATGVSGAIAVTGWALDDSSVASLKVYRDAVSADPPSALGPNGKVYLGDGTFVSGARPDVAATFPSYPDHDRAAWGYMLLTNFLPSGSSSVGGNGTFTLYAYAAAVDGGQALLGSKTIAVDNAAATKPFGTIDTPAQGATVSGTIQSFGWALTPGTAKIPTDGSTIIVHIDGTPRGTASYNLPRSDVQSAFPGYTNTGDATSGPVGVFTIDTTQLTNGVHTIFWIVTDDQNRSEGIGSRYFTVAN